jgi:hypothetical protein
MGMYSADSRVSHEKSTSEGTAEVQHGGRGGELREDPLLGVQTSRSRSTEAKEAIYLSRLLLALTLQPDKPLTIQCDNLQTIRLLRLPSYRRSSGMLIAIRTGGPTTHQPPAMARDEKDNLASDDSTKTLGKVRFRRFTEMIGVEDQKTLIRHQDELPDELLEMKKRCSLIRVTTGKYKHPALVVKYP